MDDLDIFYSKEVIDETNDLLNDCIYSSNLSMLSIESKSKIYKMDLVNACDLLQ